MAKTGLSQNEFLSVWYCEMEIGSFSGRGSCFSCSVGTGGWQRRLFIYIYINRNFRLFVLYIYARTLCWMWWLSHSYMHCIQRYVHVQYVCASMFGRLFMTSTKTNTHQEEMQCSRNHYKNFPLWVSIRAQRGIEANSASCNIKWFIHNPANLRYGDYILFIPLFLASSSSYVILSFICSWPMSS